MGASSSKIEEDKALQLCRERKKFVRQALDGRCSLAASHVTYVQSLRSTGTALRKFIEPETQLESSLYTSTNATPEPVGLTEKSLSHFSIPSPLSHPVDNNNENFSPSPSPPSSSTRFHANHMKFRGFSSTKVEEKPPLVVTETVTSSSTPQNVTPREKPENSPFESSSVPPGTPPWDFFGLFHPIDHQFSVQEGKEMKNGEHLDDLRRLREEEGIPELEDDLENRSFHGSEEYEDSEDEFDDPPTDSLVRRFENLNRVQDLVSSSVASASMPSTGNVGSRTILPNGEKSNSPDLSPLRNAPDLSPLRNGPDLSSLRSTPDLSPLRSAPDLSPIRNPASDAKKSPMKETQNENKVSPKDFFLSVKEIELLFIKASEAGKEVPRMLEANKLHFRPIAAGKENGSVTTTFFKACFSCGEDPSQAQEEPAQNPGKYLTWHRTESSRSSSSRNPLGSNAKDENEDNLFDNYCMISGSHASTLDRLYAWERKLYDEVKASEMVRKQYDSKRTILRQLESKGEHSQKIDKTRAVVKDLHSRIRVAIHRIDSISKRIEELRDKELQPQLEELIDGLSRMWGVMHECHSLQFQTITVAYNNTGTIKFSPNSESHRQIAMNLENDLYSLSSHFMKWIDAQKSYLQAINNWLFKCVFLPEKSSRRRRKQPSPSWTLRKAGPPIYVTCGVWLEKLEALPAKEVVDAMKGLAAETARLLPRQEKNQGKNARLGSEDARCDSGVNMLRGEGASDDFISGFDRFRASLEGFLGQFSNFSECSVKMYGELRKAIEDAKHPPPMPPQPQVV